MDTEGSLLSRWIERYGARLWPVARAFARDGDDAEDLLQEMWLVALRRRHTLPEDAPVGAWLHRILLNLGRAHRRKANRRALLLGRWGWGRSEDAGPGASWSRERVRRLLWHEIAELPDLQRQVLLLRIVEDMSTAEAAQAIQRAEGTVKASLHRALARLEERLRAVGVDPSMMSGGW